MSEADRELAALGYPQSILAAFEQGVGLDLRVRFAMQLLTSPSFASLPPETTPEQAARDALDTSTELFRIATERGLVTPLDHATGMTPELIAQAKRMGAFQFYQQQGANQASQENMGKVATLSRPGLNG